MAKKTRSPKKHETDGLIKEFLSQIAQAAYLVALKTGFRGSFIHFLSELQTALENVIRQDQKKLRAHH